MKELTIKEYAELIKDKPENVRGRIRTIDKLKKQLYYLEAEQFFCCSIENEAKMKKLRDKIKASIQYDRFKGNITVYVECKHENIKRSDGCDECLDCGIRNY